MVRANIKGFDIMHLDPWLVQNYPFELCHEVWTEFQTYWKFPGNSVAGGRQRDWEKCILLLAPGLSAVCVAISIVIILDKHLQVFDDGIKQYRVRWQLVVFRENLNVSKSGQNFMAWFRRIVLHLPSVQIHNIKPFYVGSHHAKGFANWCMYKENNYGLDSHTSDE